jgi:hypothetical protein
VERATAPEDLVFTAADTLARVDGGEDLFADLLDSSKAGALPR